MSSVLTFIRLYSPRAFVLTSGHTRSMRNSMVEAKAKCELLYAPLPARS
jgi:hypothetical protein